MRLRPGDQVGMLRAALADDVIPLATPVRLTTGETVSQIPIRKGDIVTAVSVRSARFPRPLRSAGGVC
jgi:hypothetical protein